MRQKTTSIQIKKIARVPTTVAEGYKFLWHREASLTLQRLRRGAQHNPKTALAEPEEGHVN